MLNEFIYFIALCLGVLNKFMFNTSSDEDLCSNILTILNEQNIYTGMHSFTYNMYKSHTMRISRKNTLYLQFTIIQTQIHKYRKPYFDSTTEYDNNCIHDYRRVHSFNAMFHFNNHYQFITLLFVLKPWPHKVVWHNSMNYLSTRGYSSDKLERDWSSSSIVKEKERCLNSMAWMGLMLIKDRSNKYNCHLFHTLLQILAVTSYFTIKLHISDISSRCRSKVHILLISYLIFWGGY